MRITAIRGFSDILPGEVEIWQAVEAKAREVFSAYNFSEIRIPILEKTELFSRSIGEATDIVEKEMYTFEDRDEWKSGELDTSRREQPKLDAQAGRNRRGRARLRRVGDVQEQNRCASSTTWVRCSAASGRKRAGCASFTRSAPKR